MIPKKSLDNKIAPFNQTYIWQREKTSNKGYTCPIHKTVLMIGDRWTLFIIREFLYNSPTQGFNQLLRNLKPISSRTLSVKLKRLEFFGILYRSVISEKPKRVSYSITVKGKKLHDALEKMGQWYTCSFPMK